MKDVVCAAGVELLMDYMEGILAADTRAALDRHVAGCERCAAFVASYSATPRILRNATDVALPETVETSLKTFLRAATSGFKSR